MCCLFDLNNLRIFGSCRESTEALCSSRDKMIIFESFYLVKETKENVKRQPTFSIREIYSKKFETKLDLKNGQNGVLQQKLTTSKIKVKSQKSA